MISWRATSIVITRRSIFTIRSTIGIRKINPGPFVPDSLPSRKITPRSYSRRIRATCGIMSAAKIMIGINEPSNLADSSSMQWFFSGLWDDFQSQTFDAYDLDGMSPIDRRIAGRGPAFTFNENLPVACINWRHGTNNLSKHCLFADLNGQTLRSESFADNENEERGRDNHAWNDIRQREPEERVSAVEKHQRADEECHNSASC